MSRSAADVGAQIGHRGPQDCPHGFQHRQRVAVCIQQRLDLGYDLFVHGFSSVCLVISPIAFGGRTMYDYNDFKD
nr:MAG TPA: hypothetical protein [Caudoviricetes sp.]